MHKDTIQRSLLRGVVTLWLTSSITLTAAADHVAFGFSGPEVFPVDHQVFGLQAADFDGDGRTDLVLVNNLRSRVNILYQRSEQAMADAQRRPIKPGTGVNALPPDARFAVHDLLMETRVGGMVAADFNGDGRPDLAVLGDARQLLLHLNDGQRRWHEAVALETTVSQAGMNTIAAGDLNGDARSDVALLGDGYVEIWAQAASGGLEQQAGKIPYAGQPRALQVRDVNGDSRDDLLLMDWDDKRPLRVRLQDESGRLGPETQVEMPRIRAFEIGDLDHDGRIDWVTIAQSSGRAHVGRLQRSQILGKRVDPTLRLLPLPRTSTARRGILWADLNGDQRTDLIYAESDQGQLRVITQDPAGRLGDGRLFPSLTGISEIARADWDDDGKAELFVFSPEEKQVGVIRPGRNGRLPFPELFGLRGKPLALAVGRFVPGEAAVVAVLVDDDGRRALYLRRSGREEQWLELPDSFRLSPTQMFFHDIDQNGVAEIVCLTPYEKIAVLTREKNGGMTVSEIFPPGGAVAQPAHGLADLDGDGKAELLLPQKNFVRAVVLEPNSGSITFRVKEQINGAAGDSRIAAILADAVEGGRAGSLHLWDAARNRWSSLTRNRDGVWEVVREVELSNNDFEAAEFVQIGGTAVAFAGPNTVGWLTQQEAGWRFERGTGYDTVVDKGRLMDVKLGDLNDDGTTEVLFIESARHHLEIATVTPAGTLAKALSWPVFEERTFRNVGGGLPEPREAIIADLTGDKKNDIAILVHDRVLLYPQE